MLMKIGDVTSKYGITNRSLYYWESAGILQSSRAENDYRYYDEENLLKIKQIVLLRKLKLSIPSIQAIFASQELSKVIAVFTAHWEETTREAAQLDALVLVLRQLINMLKDRQKLDSVYEYLDTMHSAESAELKAALQAVLSEPAAEIAVEPAPEPVIDMTGVDLALVPMTREDIPAVEEIVRQCYARTGADMDKLFFYFNFENQTNMPDCARYYKIMHSGECIGAVNLTHTGMESMDIRCLALLESDWNVYLFELLKQAHPDILCWNVGLPHDADDLEDFRHDWDNQKRRFADDNGFTFYTDSRWNHYIKMMKPHDEVYNAIRYRFALLDGSMNNVAFRFFGVNGLDFYDGSMTDWRIADCNFSNMTLYDTWAGNSRFYETGFNDSDFRYGSFDGSTFFKNSFKDCRLNDCELGGMTVDGANVKDALEFYRNHHK